MSDERTLKYTAPPTVAKFMRSDARFRVIMGGVGSGKSTGCVMEILRRCIQMNKAPDGKRKSRVVIVRNTMPQLKDTTMKTFFDWCKPGVMGTYKESEKVFHLNFNDVKAEILFRALDTPEDVQKVLSLEIGMAWLNEAREIPLDIVQALQGRLGRYPARKDVPDYWYGMIADTNPPEIDSVWYRIIEHLPLEEDNPNSVMECDSFIQPSGLSPEAENTENLVVGYYDNLARGKTAEFVEVYIHGQYAKSQAGRPVYQRQYRHDRHVAKSPIKIYQSIPVVIGHDFARNPAAVFMQMHPDGRIKILREAVGSQIGIQTFIARHSRPIIRNDFNGVPGVFVGDPSGVTRNNTDENNCFMELEKEFKRKQGYRVRAAATNDPITRINALGELLSQYPDGDPLVEIDPSCKVLIEGLRSKYRYPKLKGFGEKYAENPEKNHPWSDVVDAAQYGALFIQGRDYDPADYVRSELNRQRQVTHRPADSYAGY